MTTRREFLQAGSIGLGALGLGRLPAVSAQETKVDPSVVRLDAEVEPLVRLLEETPREDVIPTFVGRIEKGLSYREVVATLLLAGVRNVAPRPSVGFQFHTVLAVNSCHLASLSSPPEHRWLPLLWGLDYFKSAAARDQQQSKWTMPPVDDSAVPSPSKARAAFDTAMQNWDEEAADVAAAGLARAAGANEVFEIFARLGCRDFRSIGHKAIYAANAYRTLNTIGWQHAEPVVRSLAYAMTYSGGANPATSDLDEDRPFRRNTELAKTIRDDWRDGEIDADATNRLLATLRTGSNDEVCDQVVETLNSGVSPQSVWDALFLASGELLMRQPGIVGLHTLTTTNALGYAYRHSADDETRRLLMLQNAAFLPMFRAAMNGRGNVRKTSLDDLVPSNETIDSPDAIFADVGKDNDAAASQVLSFLAAKDDGEREGTRAKALVDAARLLVFRKGDDAHDWKFSSAVLEDYRHVSPTWRDRYLATAVFNLPGESSRDNGLVRQAATIGAR